MTFLPGLGGGWGLAADINDLGEVVGAAAVDSGAHHAFLFNGLMTDLQALTGGLGGSESSAFGISENGSLIAGWATTASGATHAFLYDGTMKDIDPGGSVSSGAAAVNDAGKVVGGYWTGSQTILGFVYQGGVTTKLGTLGGASSWASDVNAAGDAVGSAELASGANRAALYQGATPQDLGVLPGFTHSYAHAINDYGEIVGESTYYPGGRKAFLYRNGQMLDLAALSCASSDGWQLFTATGINDKGQIVGTGYNGSGVHAFLLTPNTLRGTNVVATPTDSLTGATPVTLTFDNVTVPGGTTLLTSTDGPTPPHGFTLGTPAVYYNLYTTVSYTGSIKICIDSTGIDFAGSPPQLFHYENGAWIDVTTSVNGSIVCGSVTSLSPFALFAAPSVPTYHICPLYDPSKAVKSGSTIPIKLQLCDANGANLSSPGIILHATGVKLVSTDAPGALEDGGNANPDNNFRYDATLGGTGGYIYNLTTKGLASGTYALEFTAGADTHVYRTQFEVR
jgi:probable HAF family extracellular repeat protein